MKRDMYIFLLLLAFSVAVVVCGRAVLASAAPVDAGAVVAPATAPTAPQTIDASSIPSRVVDALREGHYKPAIALVLLLVIYAVRTFGSRVWPWLRTDRGGVVLVMSTSIAGAVLTWLALGGDAGPQRWADAIEIAVEAAGGYAIVKKAFLPAD